MYILGLEGSANKLGVGIMKDDIVLSNKRKTYTPPNGEGFIPKQTANHHKNNIINLITESLEEAAIKITDIDLICYTKGPGMYQPLCVVMIVARTLSIKHQIPLIPVNHCVAHIEMGRFITNAVNPVILYASGCNTQIIAYNNNKYKIFGETLDVAVGNLLDKCARILNLDNFPSPGFSIEKKAREGSKYIILPYCIKGMEMSFSGIYQQVTTLVGKHSVEDICYSLQETIFSMLVEGMERCLSFVNSNEVLMVGGVGCNLRLQEMMKIMLEERGGKLYATDEKYCIDNGLMIARTGYLMYKSGHRYDLKDCDITQRFRTDTVFVDWRNK